MVEPPYRMLETVRAYAAARLEKSGRLLIRSQNRGFLRTRHVLLGGKWRLSGGAGWGAGQQGGARSLSICFGEGSG